MLATTLVAALLPLLALAEPYSPHAHTPRHRRHAVRRPVEARSGAGAAPPSAPRALPADTNAGHKSARRAIERTLKKKRGQCQAAASSSTAAASATYVAAAASTTTTAASSTAAWAAASSASSSSDDDWSSYSSAWVNAWAQPSASSATAASSSSWSDSSYNDNAAVAVPSSAANTWSAATSSSDSWAATSTSSAGSAVSSLLSSVVGLIDITDATCGWCDSSDAAPNGSEDWLNCGVSGAGWTPPMLTLDQVKYVDLTTDGPFAACSDYFYLFNEYGPQYDLPPIFLASFALQESTCSQWATGGNGEAGLMQLATANCANAPNGNCYDLDYNVKTGASYFASLIKQYNGNVVEAIGSYNGWTSGMTYAMATAAKSEGDCSGQNNLDYLAQFLNGWMQNKEGTSIGQYFNLNGC